MQSGSNPSPPALPANRENNSDFWGILTPVFEAPKATTPSILGISHLKKSSEEKKEEGNKS